MFGRVRAVPATSSDVPHASLQSVPWRLSHAGAGAVRLRWTSATCDPSLRPQACARVVQGDRRVTISVYVRVTEAVSNVPCAGVGVAGNLPVGLRSPIEPSVTARHRSRTLRAVSARPERQTLATRHRKCPLHEFQHYHGAVSRRLDAQASRARSEPAPGVATG